MEQGHKELLLKDLCGRLPYGVKIKTSYGNIEKPIELKSVNPKGEAFTVGGKFTAVSGLRLDLYDCKPYLFPLSSMTIKQKAELSMLVVDVEDIFKSFLIEVEFYHKHHIDYRGLIPIGLAIDATNLNVYSKEE